MKKLFVFLLAFLFSCPAMAQGRLQFELAEDRVDITTGFNGTSVVAFGTVPGLTPQQNMVVIIKGPETKAIVRLKSKGITGVWSNDKTVEFRRVPSYYDYALLNEAVEDSVTPSVLSEAEIGTEHLAFYSEDDLSADALEPFHDALIRRMRVKGFYAVKPSAIEFPSKDLFKVTFAIPPGVPTGTYTAEATVFENGVIVETLSKTLQVGQVGFNARVYLFANNYSLFYGILSVVLAVVFGWSAFTFLRRD